LNHFISTGPTNQLLILALITAFVSFILFFKAVPVRWLALTVLIKVGIPFIYFSWFNYGQWLLIDDVEYYYIGKELLDAGFNPISNETFLNLLILSGGNHILYGWLNFFAQYLFGSNYFVVVFINVFFTFVAGYLLHKIVIISGFSKNYAYALFFFFILHWDILAWSSFVNLKDILVLTFTTLLFYFLIKTIKKFKIFDTFILLLIFFCFYWLRFYVPLLSLAALFIFILLNDPILKKVKKLFTASLGLVIVFNFIGFTTVSNYWGQLDLTSFINIGYGMVRMMLTPQPWSIDSRYSFLILPSFYHLLFFIPTVIGGMILWFKSKFAKLCIIYLITAFILYASFYELQGPRHRVQLSFIIIWMQFHFIWWFFNSKSKNSSNTQQLIKIGS